MVGRSEPGPAAYDVPGVAADLLGVMDALAVQQAHLVGFAIGSAIAIHAAIQAPERVRSLVIGAAGAGTPRRDDDLAPGLQAEMRRAGYETFLREHALNDQAFGARTRAEHPQRIEALADVLERRAAPRQSSSSTPARDRDTPRSTGRRG